MGDTPSKASAPPAADFDVVHPRDKSCLGDGTDAVPSDSPRCPIHLRMAFGKWKTRGEYEDIKIIQRRGSSSTGDRNGDYAGLKLRRYARIERRPMELICTTTKGDNTTRVLGIISPNFGSESISVTSIYSPRSRFEGQVPETTDDGNQQQTKPRFLWAKVTGQQKPKHGAYYSRSLASFNTMEMAEEAQKLKRGDEIDGLSSYRSEEALSNVGPQIIIWRGTKAVASIRTSTGLRSDESTLEITIAPGIDPCLIICLVAHIINRMHVLQREIDNDNLLSSLLSSLCCC